MIAIKFSPIYEDRVSIYLKNSKLKNIGVSWDFKDSPYGEEDTKECFWLINYGHSKLVNPILSALVEMKSIMGIEKLSFSYCYNEKEFYCQYTVLNSCNICWFEV